ncbi:hypothetical protein V6N11_073711 [Hibiscus sabdariffa]|uniref:Uncharacterized protein n=1 Tax=Hibiscus sabdariffa TaxID=183260 RepID=A0ABR2ADZ3_9ROSI
MDEVSNGDVGGRIWMVLGGVVEQCWEVTGGRGKRVAGCCSMEMGDCNGGLGGEPRGARWGAEVEARVRKLWGLVW